MEAKHEGSPSPRGWEVEHRHSLWSGIRNPPSSGGRRVLSDSFSSIWSHLCRNVGQKHSCFADGPVTLPVSQGFRLNAGVKPWRSEWNISIFSRKDRNVLFRSHLWNSEKVVADLSPFPGCDGKAVSSSVRSNIFSFSSPVIWILLLALPLFKWC